MESLDRSNFLKNISHINSRRQDNLRYEFDKHLHYYGNHFKYPYEDNKSTIKDVFKEYVNFIFTLYKLYINKNAVQDVNFVLSNAYFSVNEELKKLGYAVFFPNWYLNRDKNILNDLDIFYASNKLKKQFKNLSLSYLLSEDFLNEVDVFEEKLRTALIKKNVKAIFVPNDMSFFENISIDVCKQIGVPSFVFLHGLPGRYNQIDDQRSDYLIVWGEKIKENYVKIGMNPNKIFVSGHPYYKDFKFSSLKFSFENILILTKPLNGVHMSDGVILADRANLLLYLYSVEKTLKKNGIKSVRFRPHPSENENWYLKSINNDFFKLDTENLQKSIKSSSLVIGPTSTVFLECIYWGINYVVYDPSVDNIDLVNCILVPPFDGTDNKIPVAKNVEDLEYILKNKIKVDPSCFGDYITTPFDLSFVKNII